MSKGADWQPADVKPSRAGVYEVMYSLGAQRSFVLVGRASRFWDGDQWRSSKGGPVSSFGESPSHQWRFIEQDLKEQS